MTAESNAICSPLNPMQLTTETGSCGTSGGADSAEGTSSIITNNCNDQQGSSSSNSAFKPPRATPTNDNRQDLKRELGETPSTTSMRALTTPSPVAAAAGEVAPASFAAAAAPGAAATAAASTEGEAEAKSAGEEQQVNAEEQVICLNVNALLPKKTKHGRIGGSLYRALRDAGVDVASLGIPRGRPPRVKVGQKRPKRPTLLSMIKSGAELPMVPGAPRLRIVDVEEGAIVSFAQLRDLTNRQQQRNGGSNKRARVDEEPIDGLVADDAAATGLLLLLGDKK